MSKISLSPSASGTGTFTIASPNSSTDRTLTLPDQTGTVLTGSGAIGVNASAPTSSVNIDSSGNVGIGTSSPVGDVTRYLNIAGSGGAGVFLHDSNQGVTASDGTTLQAAGANSYLYNREAGFIAFGTSNTERMRIDSSGQVFIACTSNPTSSSTGNGGFYYEATAYLSISANNQTCLYVNRIAGDGTLVAFRESGATEGSISVSGTTVSYNGGHLSRWSQWQNETGQPSVYRGTILESTNDMCEWEKDGEPLPNEQATKTIVSTTVASKAVAGVFDRYDEDDETNPYDFYVAQSGDFVIRIAQGVVVQNGDLLESAGDGTAKPQADDICRSSTVAKVTSNYVSATYEDGSYCVPCILMIG